LAVATVLASLALVPAAAGAAEPVLAPDEISVEGRGWGHGRGLSQYGALGYAVDHGWTSDQILDHFYSNTTAGDPIADDDIKVHLTVFDLTDLLATSKSPFTVEGIDFAPGEFARVQVTGEAKFRILRSAGCGDVGTELAAGLAGTPGQNAHPYVEALPSNVDPSVDDVDQMLAIVRCDDANNEVTRRAYRGAFRLVEIGGAAYIINRLPLEQYLRGVVPRESPAWWGGLGEGRGVAALEAQAVAARSYAMALAAVRLAQGRAADTCDTTACQVYGGAGILQPGGGVLKFDHGDTYVHSNAAIAATAGHVRRTAGGAIALTEFSSSTGGWTAPLSEGSGFPDVEDLGDAIGKNPNHVWTTTIARSDIENAYPEIGLLIRIDVTQRNGLGPWGGRTRALVLTGTEGKTDPIEIPNWGGDSFRRKFGLKSDWYRFLDFTSTGFWVVKSDGAVFEFGEAQHHGDASTFDLNQPIVGMAATPTGLGYWLVAADGGIFSFGDADFYGSTGDLVLNEPIVGMTALPDGSGYWFVASDGGVFAFGDAPFLGSMGAARVNKSVVDMATTASGGGYWLIATDGGVFSFGDAEFHGSTGAIVLAADITAFAVTRGGGGYWFVAADGGVFTFGDAEFAGSRGNRTNRAPVIGIAATPSDRGYWLLLENGTSYPFGDAPDYISSVVGSMVVEVELLPN